MADEIGREVVGRDEWAEAQRDHLHREKELTRLRDQLSSERRALPWTEVAEDYEFAGADGPIRLSELFGDCQQLIIYHFMYGEDWDEGCPSCSFWADNFNGIEVHLKARDTAFAAVSIADYGELAGYKTRMGWTFPWVSSAMSPFNEDMGVTLDASPDGMPNYNFGTQVFGGGEAPGISAFRKGDDGVIYLTYQTFSRGLDLMNGAYHFLDLTSKGRDEGDLEWPMAWLHRHDAYPT